MRSESYLRSTRVPHGATLRVGDTFRFSLHADISQYFLYFELEPHSYMNCRSGRGQEKESGKHSAAPSGLPGPATSEGVRASRSTAGP